MFLMAIIHMKRHREDCFFLKR
ncbi:Hypothetical protein BBMN68_1005 [Bifidobacterium longum subsp. longum BBMN68]|nr:Hypothetical protein BBMN68_1005 [Bifidobacterium longum subsp. longum BBMN68]